MSTADTLDSRIRSMIAELIESAPQAPALPELEWRDTGEVQPRTRNSRPSGRRSLRQLAATRRRRILAAALAVMTMSVAVAAVVYRRSGTMDRDGVRPGPAASSVGSPTPSMLLRLPSVPNGFTESKQSGGANPPRGHAQTRLARR
jgi:hypothetical protein